MLPELPGYRVVSLLYESSKSTLYRGVREPGGLPVILKMHKKDSPSVGEVIRHKREFEIARELAHIPVVARVFELLEFGRKLVLVMEDFPGKSLQAWMEEERLTLRRVLEIGIGVAEGLGQLHAARVIHKDIKPGNILVHPDTRRIRIIDFGISTLLPKENVVFESLQRLEGTPAYVSPEQTGRINRSVDFRTDFYSFGATLYHMLTGVIPFNERDSSAVVLCQISRAPVPPHRLDSEIPEVLSDIVLKLLAKTPEARYQSARGIQIDLEECLQRLEADQTIRPFPIAQRDMSNNLLIPQKLYGRARDVETLLSAFERVRAFGNQMILISGHSGIGKTVLVQEIHKPLTLQQGTFITGKYDQLDRNRPYSALVTAFRQLAQFLLAETEERRKHLGDSLRQTLGQQGQVILEIFPEFEELLGPQPAIPFLSPAQRENRFHLVFQKFLGVLASADHPLVIFLDDLQWADTPSLTLLTESLTGPLLGHLLVIGAYRDNEVRPSHPLLRLQSALQQGGCPVSRIQLAPLSLQDVCDLVSETLRCDPLRTQALSELLLRKTEGNPFFLSEFLQGLYREKLLVLNQDPLEWEWDLLRIQSHSVPDTVAHLLVQRIQHLGAETQRLLQNAAFMGNPFDLKTLAALQGTTEEAVRQGLASALEAGLVFPIGAAYQAAAHRFAHDRIQQAAASLVPQSERKDLHRKLGIILLEHHPPERDQTRVFDIVHHLNLAASEEDPKEERLALARWNLLAGTKAKESAAYQPARSFFEAGIECLGARGWADSYETRLALQEGAAEAALLSTDYPRMNRLIEEILDRARGDLDRAKAYQIRLIGHTAEHQLNQALDCALTCLGTLGIRLPRDPNRLHVLIGYTRTRLKLRSRPIAQLIDLPEVQDESVIVALPILDRVATAAFYACPNLFALTVFTQVRTVLTFGNTPWAAGAYARLGGILCGVVSDIDTGYQLGRLALLVTEKYPGVKENGSTVFEVAALVEHWKSHLESTLAPLQRAFEMSRDLGDFEYAALSALVTGQHRMFLGQELSRLESDMAGHSQAIWHLKQATPHAYNEIFRQMVLNLLGRSSDPCQLVGQAYDERQGLSVLVSADDRTGQFTINTLKLILCCVFGEFEQALEWTELARSYVDAAVGLFGMTRFYEYDSVVRLALTARAPRGKKRHLFKIARRNLKKIRHWARHSPDNHLHWVYLIEAQDLRARGQFAPALEKYLRAIELAERNRFNVEIALFNELMAECYQAGGMDKESAERLDKAYHAYLKWGALGKARQLDRRHRASADKKRAGKPREERIPDKPEEEVEETVVPPLPRGMVGLSAIAHGERIITSEEELKDLLRELMTNIMESAGAERVCLILRGKDEEQLRVCALIDETTDLATFDSAEPMDTFENLPSSLIRYACRTREQLIWDPLKPEDCFVRDPYVAQANLRAIACIPLEHPDGMLGLFYLESKRADDAFSAEVIQSIHSYVKKATDALPRTLFEAMNRGSSGG